MEFKISDGFAISLSSDKKSLYVIPPSVKDTGGDCDSTSSFRPFPLADGITLKMVSRLEGDSANSSGGLNQTELDMQLHALDDEFKESVAALNGKALADIDNLVQQGLDSAVLKVEVDKVNAKLKEDINKKAEEQRAKRRALEDQELVEDTVDTTKPPTEEYFLIVDAGKIPPELPETKFTYAIDMAEGWPDLRFKVSNRKIAIIHLTSPAPSTAITCLPTSKFLVSNVQTNIVTIDMETINYTQITSDGTALTIDTVY